jgi:hypothetical protein
MPINESNSSNYIRDLIFKSLAVSIDSNIPVLFLSNPGLGKTTNVRLFCETYGYTLEEGLRGANSSPEEVLGYKVNTGKSSLETMYPDWFERIQKNSKESAPGKNDGKKFLLFIDEITGAPEYTQAALLKLIFDREINGVKLPEGTLIAAAGNYKNNLSGQFNMLPPTLNRFMIVNLRPQNPTDFISEFVKYDPKKMDSVIKFNKNPVTEDIIERAHNGVYEMFTNLFTIYGKDSSLGKLDFNNTGFQGVYDDADGAVYGFMSGRTMSYTAKLAVACYANSIIRADEMLLGLIGLGTNQLDKDKQLPRFHQEVCKRFSSLLNSLVSHKTGAAVKSFKLDTNKTISDLCNEFIQIRNEGNPDEYEMSKAAKTLSTHIKKTLTPQYIVKIGNSGKVEDIRGYISDIDYSQRFSDTVREFAPDAAKEVDYLIKINKNYYNTFLTKISNSK